MLENGKRKGSAMNIEIAQRLYELRRKHGFSQESLAAELGLSRQAISKWERSESAPDMGNLIALADLYGMTIDELIRPAVKDDTDSYSEDSADAADPTDTPQPEQSHQDNVAKQVYAHGHVYARPAAADTRPRCALRKFPYPLLIVVLVLLLVIVFGLWEYIWLFLTIPFYYWIARVIERDPLFLESHGYASRAQANASDEGSSSKQPSYDEVYAVNAANSSKEVR